MKTLDPAAIRKMAEGYTDAWCSRSSEQVASFFSEGATSIINAGEPTVGRPAIAEAMGAFFADFPDLFDWLPPDGGCIAFPRFRGAGGECQATAVRSR